jgi:hypothetical protein
MRIAQFVSRIWSGSPAMTAGADGVFADNSGYGRG